MPSKKTHRPDRLLLLSILVGIVYSSWPLGYWLNPEVSKNSLASGLEGFEQPYNWVFVSMDVMSSCLLIILCWLLWRRHRLSNRRAAIRLGLICVGLFALGTITDALLPEHCVPNLMRCASFTHDHTLLVHGIFSITASAFLFFSLVITWFHMRRNALLSTLLSGYILFAALSLIEAVVPGKNGNWSENYYITLCSVLLACLPYTVALLAKTKS